MAEQLAKEAEAGRASDQAIGFGVVCLGVFVFFFFWGGSCCFLLVGGGLLYFWFRLVDLFCWIFVCFF